MVQRRKKAWETRLERRDLGCLAARAVTVQSVGIIPQLLIVPLTWPLLQSGVLRCMYVRERERDVIVSSSSYVRCALYSKQIE